MADTVTFELVSPEKLIFSEPVDMVVVPGTEGLFGVLPGHALMVSGVEPGVVDVYRGGKIVRRIFVAGGFAEVTPDRCTVLADTALPLEDLDREAVAARIRGLREDLADAVNDGERAAAAAHLRTAEAMLAAVERA